jgi:hypothetical protein
MRRPKADDIKNETLIHYGADVFDKKLFLPIGKSSWRKPTGGLWTSPINSNYGWKQWCKDEHFYKKNLKKSFKLQLKSNARILLIHCLSDLKRLKSNYLLPPHLVKKTFGDDFNTRFPDFEYYSKKYDAIWLTEQGRWKTRLTRPYTLYGWDMETVFIMNPNCFKIIRNQDSKSKSNPNH